MTVEIALLISFVSVAFGIYSIVSNASRNHKVDTQKDATDMTMVIVKLENISLGITEIKTEFNVMKSEVKGLRDKLVVNEQSLISAWKQIDGIITSMAK